MKKTVSLLLALLFLTLAGSLLSCGGGGENSPDGEPSSGTEGSVPPIKKPDSVSFAALLDAVSGAVGGNGEFVPRDDDYLENMMGISPSSFANCSVLVTSEGGSIDEYGIFEISPGADISKTDAALREYLAFYNDIWDDRYNPKEYPKLRDAEIKTFGGRFALYAIMREADREALFRAAEKLF